MLQNKKSYLNYKKRKHLKISRFKNVLFLFGSFQILYEFNFHFVLSVLIFVTNHIQMEIDTILEKSVLLDWASKLLSVNITKVSQLSNGAVFLRLYDLACPRKLNHNRVIWKAVTEAESLMNLRMLSEQLKKMKKHISIDKISKSNAQQSLELLCWFRNYFQANSPKAKTLQVRDTKTVAITELKPPTIVIKQPTVVKSILKKADSTYASMAKMSYDEKKVAEIEELLQKEKQLKATDKIERIKGILFKKSPNSQIKNTLLQNNNPNASNIRRQFEAEKTEVREERRKSPIGRESLLINLPMSVDERTDLRKSQNLLDCGLDPA